MSAFRLRGMLLLVSVAAAWGATGLSEGTLVLRSVLVGHASFFALGALLATRRPLTPPLLLLLLAGDLLAVGAVGCWLHEGFEPQLSFLAGYTVAVLVSVVGRTTASAVLGTLAGTMVMGLVTTLFAMLQREAPDVWHLGYQMALLAAGSVLTARVSWWMDEEARRRLLNERVQQALQEREAEAAELVTFAQGLAESGSLMEVAEAVVSHMRCHFPVRARAAALEAHGEGVALWEEEGRLDEDRAERRRAHLQASLAATGSHHAISRLTVRSQGHETVPERPDFVTAMRVPIRAGGRTAGVLFLGDGRRGVVDERRIGILADVARRTGEAVLRIERQTTEEQRRTALLLKQMREGVLLLGDEGRVLLANPAARQLLGCGPQDAPLPPAIGEVSLAELALTPAGISRRFRARLQVDPEQLPLELACCAVGVLDGSKRIGTLVTLADVTQEEMARSRLYQSEKLTLVGQTLAGVAHELNNPLTALIGYTDLLVERNSAPEISPMLQKVQEQATRASRIVKNLLSVARQREPERVPVRLGPLVESVAELFAYEARLANVKLDVDLPADLPEVMGDKHALQQVFVNLMQNALHALHDWSGKRWIYVTGQAIADEVVVTMADGGPGIPEGLRARIFQPFFTTKGASKGTGLGLAISRTIARDHGGDILLDDEPGAGARFVVRLPRPQRIGPSQAAEAPAEAERLSLRVLVVDDEADVREALVAQLTRLGCRVDSTSGAEEALEQVGASSYDVLLVDCRMPDVNGLEFHQRLAGRDRGLAARVIFMTGDFANEELLRAVRPTGNRLLEKPFTLAELSRVLKEQAPAEPPAESESGGNGRNGVRVPAPPSGGRRTTDRVLRADAPDDADA